MNSTLVLGVDIGGSHITTALVDVTSGALLYDTLVRRMVDSKGSKTDVLDAWCAAIKPTLSAAPKDTLIGIAMPGPFDYDKGISLIKEQPKFRSLYGENIRNLLAEQLDINGRHIGFMNDASSFLQGEMLAGAAKDNREAIGITLGTGLGSAIFRNGFAEDAALWMVPFKAGIAEDYLSTRWFVQQYQDRTGKGIRGVKEISLLAATDPVVKELFIIFGQHLAEFLVLMQQKFNCNTIVIGGNIAKAADYFLDSVRAALITAGVTLDIHIGILGESAAMVGAAGRIFELNQNKNGAPSLEAMHSK